MPKIFFIDEEETKEVLIKGKKNILEISRKENLNIEGACEGSMACSTCHIIVDNKWYSKLKPPCINEVEMLALLPNYQKNSRLGCQVVITKKLDGFICKIPKEN